MSPTCNAYREGYVECLDHSPREPVTVRDLINPGGLPALFYVLLLGLAFYCYYKGTR